MKYQLTEKEIFSEDRLLHFGDQYEMGDLVNEYFPDFCGVPVGTVIDESDDLEAIKEKKTRLEIQRLKSLNGAIVGFFEEDDRAEKFYSSEDFTRLQSLYEQEFGLELIRINHNQMVVKGDEFYFPADASEEQMERIQELLGIYFFEIKN